MEPEDQLIDMIEKVVDDAMFQHKHTFKMRYYLDQNKFTKKTVSEFLGSGTANNVLSTIDDLDLLIEGGHSEMREAYPNWTRPEARVIRKYLNSIIEDARDYQGKKSKKRRSK